MLADGRRANRPLPGRRWEPRECCSDKDAVDVRAAADADILGGAGGRCNREGWSQEVMMWGSAPVAMQARRPEQGLAARQIAQIANITYPPNHSHSVISGELTIA